MLIITELGRAVDYHREDKWFKVQHELVDGLIRYLDLTGSLSIKTEEMLRKIMKNNHRRLHKHGKKY